MRHDRVYNFVFIAGQGPLVVGQNLSLPSGDKRLELTAWMSGLATGSTAAGGSNIHILRGRVTLAEAQGMLLQEGGLADFLCTIPAGGVACVPVPDDVSEITVFLELFLPANQQTQVVTVRVRNVE